MRVKSYFPILLAYVILVMSPKSFPQIHIQSQTQKLIFEHYTTDQGLSSSIVSCVIQDKIGYLWFGTHSGLDRFDGIEFKSYKYIPGDTTSITNGYVQYLLEAKDGNLWIGTSNGLDKLVRSTETLIHYQMLTRNPMDRNSNDITSIQEDQNGFIWIGTYNGLNRFNPVDCTFTYFQHDISDSASLSHNQVFTILVDRLNNLWVGTNMGLDKFDRRTGSFIHYWQDPIYRPGLNILGAKNKYCVGSLYEDDSDIIWVGTMDGLIEFDPESEKFTLYQSDPQDPKTLSFYGVRSICKKNDNSLWVGTYIGLNSFDKRTKQFKRIFYNNKVTNGISGNNISGILRERSGTLWFTTYGAGVNKLNRTIYPFKQYYYSPWRETKRFSSASILYLDKARDGSVWIGTPTGLMKFDPVREQFRSYKIKQNIRAIKEDENGNLWMGVNISSGRGFIKMEKNGRIINVTDSSGNKMMWLVNQIIEDNDSTLWLATEDEGGIINVNKFTNKFTVFYSSTINLNTIYKDRAGFIWAGTQNDGLLCFDPSDKKVIKHFLSDFKDPKSISSNSVRTICEDDMGNLWLGTDMGVNKFDRNKNTFSYFTESDGLPHNRIDHIFIDSNQNLWMSNRRGVSKFNPLTGAIKNYYVLYGLIAPDYLAVGCQLDNGEIYLDSPGGLTRFHPDSIRDNPYIPPIVITSIMAADKPIALTNSLELPFSSDHLDFEFAALSYVSPEKNLYAYKLEGLDDDWKFVGTVRNATYTNLDPGEYTFRVKGSNNDGIWNEEGASIKIIILPPYWRTTWAYILYSIIILSIIYFTWMMQIKKIKGRHELEISKFEAEKFHQIDKLKTRFFTNISHEFRTPLILIQGPAKQIIEKTMEPNTRDSANFIYRNSLKLIRLVNQLLDLSKLEAGEMHIKASETDVITFIKDIAVSFTPLAEKKKIMLKINHIEEQILTYLDKDKMHNVINNILSNAFKFTAEGGRINVNIAKNNYVVEIKISDTGIGIPKDRIDKIFDRFYQVDDTHTREQEGTGIGLALTKELVDLHKGKIKVESKEGEGSIFTISLPLGKEHLKPEQIVEIYKYEERFPHTEKEYNTNYLTSQNGFDIESMLSSAKPVLLVVEDNPDVRSFIKVILENDYKIFEACNGEEGIKISLEEIPDLIISDLMMPKMDGFEMCTKMKNDERTSHIPIIMLTAKATNKDKIEGYETGADDYIMKPFDADVLRARVNNLVEQRKKLREHFVKDGLFNLDDKNITQVDKIFLQKVVKIVNNHLSDTLFGVEALASEIALSRVTLHKKLVSLIGEPPGELIKRIRLSRGAKLLIKNHGNISEISLEVGFNNPAYFSECFRKQFGISPSQYYHKNTNH